MSIIATLRGRLSTQLLLPIERIDRSAPMERIDIDEPMDNTDANDAIDRIDAEENAEARDPALKTEPNEANENLDALLAYESLIMS